MNGLINIKRLLMGHVIIKDTQFVDTQFVSGYLNNWFMT